MNQEKAIQFFRTPSGAFAAGALVLMASFANFAGHNDYPIVSLGVALVFAAICVLSLAMAVLYRFSGPYLRGAWIVILLILAIDINFDSDWLFLVPIVAYFVLKDLTVPIAAVVAASVLASTLISEVWTGNKAAEARVGHHQIPESESPTIVHIVLDEHIGIDGILSREKKAVEAKRAVADFYLDNGFRLFTKAFSRHFHTVNAIPETLNFGEPVHIPDRFSPSKSVPKNAYFDHLFDEGYQLFVYQSTFLDYCAGYQVVRCNSYRDHGWRAIHDSSLPHSEKAALLLFGFVDLSQILRTAFRIYDNGAFHWNRVMDPDVFLIVPGERSKTSSAGSIELFDTVVADLAHAQPGHAYFVHALLPHYPYAFDPNCQLNSIWDWHMRRFPGTTVAERTSAYMDQLQCVTKKVAEIVAALDSAPNVTESIVIVHSDHGSRITSRDPTIKNAGTFSDDDVIAGFSTLAAVRAPAIEPGADRRPMTIQALLAELVRSEFREAGDAASQVPLEVVLDDKEWKPAKAHPLPESWIRD